MAALNYALVVVLAVVATIHAAPQMKDRDGTYSMSTDPNWAFRMYTYQVNKYPGAEAFFKKVSNKKFLYVIKDGKKTDNYMLDYSSWPVQLKTGAAAVRTRPDLKMTMTAEMFNKFTAPYMTRGLTEQQFDEEFNKIGLAEAVSKGEIKFEGDFILTMTLHKVWRFDYYIKQDTMEKIYI